MRKQTSIYIWNFLHRVNVVSTTICADRSGVRPAVLRCHGIHIRNHAVRSIPVGGHRLLAQKKGTWRWSSERKVGSGVGKVL
jgi:hypothetical protein